MIREDFEDLPLEDRIDELEQELDRLVAEFEKLMEDPDNKIDVKR